MLDLIVKQLEDLHGEKLKPFDETYYLFASDGVVKLGSEEGDDGKLTLKVDVTLEEAEFRKFYNAPAFSIADAMENGEGL